MPSIPLFAPVKSRDGTVSRDPFLKNAFVEPKGENGMYVFKRPGLALYSTNSAGAAQGMTSYRDPDDTEYLFTVAGGTLYNASARVPEASASSIQTLTTTTGFIINVGVQSIAALGNTAFAVGFNAARTRFAVAYSQNGGLSWVNLLDVSADGTTYPDGASSYALCSHKGKLVLALDGYSSNVWESADGVSWTKICDNSGVSGVGTYKLISHRGDLYLFDHGVGVRKSTDDGVTWNLDSSPAYTAGRIQFGACSDGTYLYVMGGYVTTVSQQIWRSADGGTWTQLGTNALSGVIASTSSENGVEVIVVGGVFLLHENVDSNAGVNKLWVSGNGTSWTELVTLASTGYATGAPSAFGVRGLFYHRDRLIIPWYVSSIGFSTNARVFSHAFTTGGPPVAVGNVGNGKLDFSQNYNRTILALKSPEAAFSISVPGSVVTAVSDADYPESTARGLVYLDGYFFVMDTDGNIFGSAPEDFTSWSALNFIAAEFEPDGGVALCKYQNYVVAFGNYTTEFFFNAGNPTGSPLSPAQNGVLLVGAANGDTVQTIDSNIYWVAQTKSGGQSPATGRFVAKLQGTGYEKLSTPDIDRILDADDFVDVDACTFKVGGHSYYHIRLGTSNLSLVFDVSQSQWYIWTTRRDSFTNTMANVVTANGSATWTGTHSFADGDVGVISGFSGTHTALNGTHNVTVPASGTLVWTASSGYSGTSSGTGTATGRSEDDFPVAYACDYSGNQLLQDKANGNVYTLSGSTYRDNGVYMDWIARPEKVDGETNNRKFVAWADFVSDRASGNVMLRYSDNDGQSWTKYKPLSMSGQRTRWHRLGAFRRRLWELRVTDNVPVRAERLEMKAVDDEATADG